MAQLEADRQTTAADNSRFTKRTLGIRKITIQPITRFDFDAAIVFSDILLVPYALGQQVSFKKDFGPNLQKIDLEILNDVILFVY